MRLRYAALALTAVAFATLVSEPAQQAITS